MKDKTIEEYCRLILKLDKGEGVRSKDVVKTLKLSKNTVAHTLQKLVKARYLEMKKYGKIKITAKGMRIAKRMNFRHRVIETFLYQKLGINKKKIHEEACKLEHAASDEMVKKLYKFLGKPKLDPHGEKIKG